MLYQLSYARKWLANQPSMVERTRDGGQKWI